MASSIARPAAGTWTPPEGSPEPIMDEGIERAMRWLREEVWPRIPEDVRNKPLTKDEREELLGYGPEGV